MGGRHILIAAPDDAESRELAELLRSGGHVAVVEADPAAVAQAVGREGLDLVVLDLGALATDPATVAAALTPRDAAAIPAPLEAVERAHILITLRHTHGNKRRAAHLLGIARSTLIQKVRRYQIQPDEVSAGVTAAD